MFSYQMAQNRSTRGNVLILIVAFTLGIIVLVVLFGLGYIRLIGTSSEQKTAIEAAAIAAAKDLSSIVVDTPEFGFVSLSDAAPIGTATAAGDSFPVPVHSINTLIGTARLDYLIASQPDLDIPAWKELAEADLNKARDAADKLIDKLKDSIKPSGTATDKSGTTVRPYISAEAAYKSNQIRMTGKSNYVSGSLKLSLGAIEAIGTNVPVPSPVTSDLTLNSTNMTGGFYKSYINVPLGNVDFVFAGVGSSIKLCDSRKWVPSISGLPYQYPTIVRAEAQQLVKNATAGDQTITAVACAQPASVFDPRPAPGALTISFPDGIPDGNEALRQPLDLYSGVLSSADDVCDYLDASPGDYPTTSGSKMEANTAVWPITSDPNILASSACKLAVFDWLRRAGTRADVDSVVGMHTTPFMPQGADVPWPPTAPVGNIPDGIAHVYRFDTDGIIDYEGIEEKPYPWWVVSDRQNLIECFDAITDGATPFTVKPVPLTIVPPISIPLGEVEFTSRYDMYVRIYSRRYGNPGGKHEGEPMDNNLVSFRRHKIAGRDRLVASSFQQFSGRGAKKKQPPLVGIGVGAIPTLMPQEDFAFKWNIINLGGPEIDRASNLYEKFDGTGGSSTLRPTYRTNGSVADIRFRRVIIGKDPVSGVINVLGSVLPIQKQQGYVGEK